MERERRGQIEQIFHAALQVEANRRSELIRQSCAGDEDLREVESLQAHHTEAGASSRRRHLLTRGHPEGGRVPCDL